MSRSYMHTPIKAICGYTSNKKFKQHEHRAERKTVHQMLDSGYEELPNTKMYGNEWDSPRDGKVYQGSKEDLINPNVIKWLRK